MAKDPVAYSDELAQKICDAIADTPQTLEEICKTNRDFPTAKTVYQWVRTRPKFGELYARAKEDQVDTLVSHGFNLIRDKSDDFYNDGETLKVNHAALSRAKLESDYIKWFASKLKRKKYGDNAAQKDEEKETPFGQNANAIDNTINDQSTDK